MPATYPDELDEYAEYALTTYAGECSGPSSLSVHNASRQRGFLVRWRRKHNSGVTESFA